MITLIALLLACTPTQAAEYPFAAGGFTELETDRAHTEDQIQESGSVNFVEQMKRKKPSESFLKIFSKQDIEKIASLIERGRKLKGQNGWYNVKQSAKAKAMKKPEISGTNRYLVRDASEILALYSLPAELSYSPTAQAVAKKVNRPASEEFEGDMQVESNVKVAKGPGGATLAVYFWKKEIGMERGVWEIQRNFLVLYDQQKRIENIFVWSHSGELAIDNPKQIEAELSKPVGDIEPNDILLVTPSYDSKGKIESLITQAAHHDGLNFNWYETSHWGKSGSILSRNP